MEPSAVDSQAENICWQSSGHSTTEMNELETHGIPGSRQFTTIAPPPTSLRQSS
jgi:hypothetical protein